MERRPTQSEERKLAERREQTEQAYHEADADRQAAQKERARFVELRKRLKRRWKDHFTAQSPRAELAIDGSMTPCLWP